MQHPHRNSGFTLIEMMIAVAILAILASVAIPAYNDYIATSRSNECAEDLASLRLAQQEFFLENNTYFGPANGADNIRTASQGLWSPGNWDDSVADATNVANLNCVFNLTAGATGDIATSYNATATGQNAIKNTVVLSVTN